MTLDPVDEFTNRSKPWIIRVYQRPSVVLFPRVALSAGSLKKITAVPQTGHEAS